MMINNILTIIVPTVDFQEWKLKYITQRLKTAAFKSWDLLRHTQVFENTLGVLLLLLLTVLFKLELVQLILR